MRTLVPLTMAGLLLVAVGCSEKPTSPEPLRSVEPIIGEMPAEVLDLLETNTPADLDPAPAGGGNWLAWPSSDLTENCDVYAVTFLWGQFFGEPSTDIAPTDWSGRLSINAVGVVHPRMTIDFEPGQDNLVPTGTPTVSAWVSYTANDFDGISFLVFLKQDITYVVAPTLSFETAPISLEFDFGELVSYNAFYMLEGGNALAVHSRKIWPPRCPGGFMEGTWIKEDNTGSQGRFEGLWLNYRGEPEGIMYGEFWTNNDGSREFDGWVTGYVLTYIIAEFKGTWWYDDPSLCMTCGQGHGWFRGHFVYANGTNRGGWLAAEIGLFHAPSVDQLQLPYRGVWHQFCPWDQEDIRTNTN